MHEVGSAANSPEIRTRAATKRKSLRDTAYDQIRRRIVNCEFKPGEVWTVSGLADELGFGRTPVIQAIDRLTVDGLVEVMPRKGVIVCPVSLDDFVEIVEMRLINEVQAGRWAAEKARKSEIEKMQVNLSASRKAARARDIEGMIELDREFHRLISAAAGNSILSELLGNLHDKALRFWFISLRAPDHNLRVCREHSEIFDGIKAHDPDRVEQAMRAHIESFRANATRQIIGN